MLEIDDNIIHNIMQNLRVGTKIVSFVPPQVLVSTRAVVPTRKFFYIELGAREKYTVSTRRPMIMKDLVEKSHDEFGINDNDA